MEKVFTIRYNIFIKIDLQADRVHSFQFIENRLIGVS